MEQITFLPGPVKLDKNIFKDLAAYPLSHRSEEFKKIFDDTCTKLSALTKAKNTALFMGSGTLANEVIAAQLSLIKGKGIILSNGEFGQRLAEQAQRFNLKFKHFAYPWGESFNYEETEKYILKEKPAWIWFTHVETSCGILNDLPRLIKICKKTGTKVCADCMSSIGNMPLNLKEVYLASASSGKGLASFNGIGIVFSSYIPAVNKKLPKYLDLGYYYFKNKIPFTFSYNLLFALYRELKHADFEKRFKEIKNIYQSFNAFFEENNICLIGNKKSRTHFIFTLAFKKKGNSLSLGDFCAKHKICVHYKNDYLRERNWVQIAFMGHHKLKTALPFFKVFKQWQKEQTI